MHVFPRKKITKHFQFTLCIISSAVLQPRPFSVQFQFKFEGSAELEDSLQQCRLPSAWKTAKIVPVHKKGNHTIIKLLPTSVC